MADGFDELRSLAADLSAAPAIAARNINSAVQYTATEIKTDWRQGAETSGDEGISARYAESIDYDMVYGPNVIGAEIGPNLGRRGGRAGFLEDAPGRVQAPAQHAGRDALHANEADFHEGLEIALFDATAEAIVGPLGRGEVGPKGPRT